MNQFLLDRQDRKKNIKITRLLAAKIRDKKLNINLLNNEQETPLVQALLREKDLSDPNLPPYVLSPKDLVVALAKIKILCEHQANVNLGVTSPAYENRQPPPLLELLYIKVRVSTTRDFSAKGVVEFFQQRADIATTLVHHGAQTETLSSEILSHCLFDADSHGLDNLLRLRASAKGLIEKFNNFDYFHVSNLKTSNQMIMRVIMPHSGMDIRYL